MAVLKDKPKRNYKKELERGDVTVEAAIKDVKEEIIGEVRAVSGGYKQSIFELVEKGKVLIELEEMLAQKLPPASVKTKGDATKKKATGGGIKPLASTDEIGEDDF